MKAPVALVLAVGVSLAGVGCGAASEDATAGDQSPVVAGKPVDVNIVFVHGVHSDDSRTRAENDLADLESRVVATLETRRADFERAGRPLRVKTARVNLYTGLDGNLIVPTIDDVSDGSGVPSANAWRAQLVAKTNQALGPTAGNIVFVGHSTGARVSAEVTAGVGHGGGPGSFDWGFGHRVAGVVTLHGMIDALNRYDFIGPTSFVTGCKFAQGKGWCEYAGHLSAVPALDWVARERHVLSLTSWGSCSPSLWTGESDKSLPFRAQSSPWSPGITMTPVDGETYGPAHGIRYGNFCHSDITNGGSALHEQAVASAAGKIGEWLFDAAPRIVGGGNPDEPQRLSGVEGGVLGPAASVAGPCPPGRRDGPRPDVAGVCVHSGWFDGDDHAFDGSSQIEIADGNACDASVRFTHRHGSDRHDARVWLKAYSVPAGGGLLSTLR